MDEPVLTPFSTPSEAGSPERAPASPPPSPECPFCREPVHHEAARCPHCRSVIGNFKFCPDCRESVDAAARACRSCGFRWQPLESPQKPGPADEPLAEVWADGLGAMVTSHSPTALFFPPELIVSRKEILITKWSLLGLRKYRQRISTSRIASVRFLRGALWGGLAIETYGGYESALVISGLRKGEAQDIAALIERLASEAR